MSDEITRLKAELVELNTKCQLARDNEVRFALQRSRLEAERTQLLVKLGGGGGAYSHANRRTGGALSCCHADADANA
jgi:hypothetical protein